MDQATARDRLAEGAFFIFLGVPEGTEFGIDMKSWNTGEKFRGVKMIPPGLHFIFYSSVSRTTEDLAPRVGFFHNFKKSEVLVKKWDRLREDVSREAIGEDEIVRLKENILALDAFLGPYPFDVWDKWQSLSSNITDILLDKLVPLSGQIRSALELQPCSDANRPRGGDKTKETSNVRQTLNNPECSSENIEALEAQLLPELKPIGGTELRVTVFPTRKYPEGATPAEITKHSLDSTYAFEEMLQKYSQAPDIVGEIEFCFICFLVGHSLEAFEQWKKLVTLFCSCELAVKKYRKLYDIFITLLEVQIKEIPEEFLADIVSNNNFVYVNLRKLFRTIREIDMDGQLKSKVDRFQGTLKDLFQWDFAHLDDDEEEDEAPVIVKTKT